MNQPLTQSRPTPPSSTQQKPVAARPASAGIVQPAHAEIAKRAYEIYLKKGRHQGQCQRNWLQAEQELRDHGTAAPQSKPSGGKPTVTASHSAGTR